MVLYVARKSWKRKKEKYIANATGTFFSSSVSSSNATGLKKPVVCNNFMIIIYIVLFNLKCIIYIQIIFFIIMRQSRDFVMIQRKPWAWKFKRMLNVVIKSIEAIVSYEQVWKSPVCYLYITEFAVKQWSSDLHREPYFYQIISILLPPLPQ